MFATYLLPVTTALTVFPIVAAILVLPAAFVAYRTRGRVGGWAGLVFYSFVFYLLAAFLQTLVPLPRDPATVCATHIYAAHPQTVPFGFVGDIVREAHGAYGPGALAANPAVWTTALNLALLVPLGVYLRYYLRTRLVTAAAAGLVMSLFFEVTQLTGVYFIYPCPYRLFNVDDLILNTSGAVLGWSLIVPLVRFLPRIDRDAERARYAGRITFARRLLAGTADLLGFAVCAGVLSGTAVLLTGSMIGMRGAYGLIGAVAVVWFWVLPALTGSTPGKRAMLIRIERAGGGPAGWDRLLIRNAGLLAPLWLFWLGMMTGDSGGVMLLLAALFAACLMVFVWSPAAALLRADHRTPYERASGTRLVAITSDAAAPASSAPLHTVP